MHSSNGPLVTIGIPTYNRAAGKLQGCIDRALAQTYQNIEVVVSDNCSSDHTQQLVESIDDPRLRYFRQATNIGPNNNFNFCLQQARGEYFLLFHDDDTIDTDFVEACVSALKPGQEVGVVFTGVRVIDGDNNVLEEHENHARESSSAAFIFGWFAGVTAIYLCSTLYNTARLKEVGGFYSKKHLYDDLVPTFTLLARHGRADVRAIKSGFRRHQNNRGSTVSINDWIEDSLYLLETLYTEMPADRALLKQEGERYFCRKMYRYIAEGLASSRTVLDYLKVYKAYHYCLSPLPFLYAGRVRPKVRALRQAFAPRS